MISGTRNVGSRLSGSSVSALIDARSRISRHAKRCDGNGDVSPSARNGERIRQPPLSAQVEKIDPDETGGMEEDQET